MLHYVESLTTDFSVVTEQLKNFSKHSKQDVTMYVNGEILFTNQSDVLAKDLSEKLSHLKQRLISEGMNFEYGRHEFMRIMRSATYMNFKYDTTFLFRYVDDELLRLLFANDLSSYNSFKQCTSVEFLHQKLQNNALYIESEYVDLEKVKEIFMRNISFFFNQPSLSQYLTTSEFIFQLFSLVYYFERAKNECISLKPNIWHQLYLDIALKMVNIGYNSAGLYDDQNIIGQHTYFKPELLEQHLKQYIFNIEIFTSTNRTDRYYGNGEFPSLYALTDKFSNLYAFKLVGYEEPQLHVNYSTLYDKDGHVELINESMIPKLPLMMMEMQGLISKL